MDHIIRAEHAERKRLNVALGFNFQVDVPEVADEVVDLYKSVKLRLAFDAARLTNFREKMRAIFRAPARILFRICIGEPHRHRAALLERRQGSKPRKDTKRGRQIQTEVLQINWRHGNTCNNCEYKRRTSHSFITSSSHSSSLLIAAYSSL